MTKISQMPRKAVKKVPMVTLPAIKIPAGFTVLGSLNSAMYYLNGSEKWYPYTIELHPVSGKECYVIKLPDGLLYVIISTLESQNCKVCLSEQKFPAS